MKLFHFYRKEDFSGVSGTGPVVEGVEFTNGWCALRWLSGMSSICFYQSLEDVKKIHSHGGKTEIIVHDFEPMEHRPKSPAENAQFELFLQVIEETSNLMTLADESGTTLEEIQSSIQGIKSSLDRLERRFSSRVRKSA